jgi:hypothetical protein
MRTVLHLGSSVDASEALAMNAFFTILLVAFMIATVYALVTGIIAFLRTTEADLTNPAPGPSQSAVKQNKAMMMRIIFQGVAILIIVLILLGRKSVG